jgi:short-subunit dehydrogenase involved in D-alanine esterification of teichoic acids
VKVAEATLQGMERNEYEIAVGMADVLRQAARTDFEKVFHRING